MKNTTGRGSTEDIHKAGKEQRRKVQNRYLGT